MGIIVTNHKDRVCIIATNVYLYDKTIHQLYRLLLIHLLQIKWMLIYFSGLISCNQAYWLACSYDRYSMDRAADYIHIS